MITISVTIDRERWEEYSSADGGQTWVSDAGDEGALNWMLRDLRACIQFTGAEELHNHHVEPQR